MKRHSCSLILLLCSACLYTGCGYAGPEKAVRRELDAIQKLDENTITSFVSYEDVQSAAGQAVGSEPDATDAIKLFFKNFKYHIDSSSQSQDGTAATVTVSITNLDAKALATDLCQAIYQNSLNYGSSADQDTSVSSFSLMKECLDEHDYPMATTTATFHLTGQDNSWKIEANAQLENELAGGLVEYLTDPYLLAPEDILDLTLTPFCNFTAQDWQNYLNISDIFAVGTSQADTIDQLLFQQIAQFFDYEITDTLQDGDTAQATVNITSLDLNAVIESSLGPLRDYGTSTESIRDSEDDFNEKTGQILMDSLENNVSSTVTPVTILLYNDGHTWDPVLDESFTDALLGNLDESLSSLNEAVKSD